MFSMNVSSELQTVVRFGVFEADFRSGELRRSGAKVRIQDLPFRTLRVLLDQPNEIVTREDFRQQLWPADIFVDFDRGISSAIKRLRDAIGDSAENPIFIETIERRGYRWIAPISIAPSAVSAISSAGATPPASEKGEPTGSNAILFREGQSPAQATRFPAWKLAYLLPVFTLLFVIWTFRSGFHSAKARNNPSTLRVSPALHHANQEARDLYLQGRFYWNKRTPDDLQKAVDRFTQAIVHDPGYADAYVGLADCYNLLREYTDMPGREAFPRALAAARKAVELDDRSSQAHASLAFSSFWGAWDAATADREFRRSIELSPENATAHHWYSTFLQEMAGFQPALVEIERAQALDPSSRSILADKAAILDQMGRRQEAVSLLQQVEKAEPKFTSPHRYLKRIYLEMGDYLGYLEESRREAVLTHDSSALGVTAAAEEGFTNGGAPGMFESILREQEKLLREGKLSPYMLAQTCARAGDRQGAMRYIKAAYDRHDEFVLEVGVDRAFNNMRDEPGLRRITQALGFPTIETAAVRH